MRSFLQLFFVLFCGLALGAWGAWYSIQHNHGFGALNIGVWTAWPSAGAADSDPYTRAKVAAEGEIPLGAAEGLAFHATEDEQGGPLRMECEYQIAGQTPLARLWTITAHSVGGDIVFRRNNTPASVVSRNISRLPDGSIDLHVGKTLSHANWLRLDGTGPYQMVLRLYDSQLTRASDVTNASMPKIRLVSC